MSKHVSPTYHNIPCHIPASHLSKPVHLKSRLHNHPQHVTTSLGSMPTRFSSRLPSTSEQYTTLHGYTAVHYCPSLHPSRHGFISIRPEPQHRYPHHDSSPNPAGTVLSRAWHITSRLQPKTFPIRRHPGSIAFPSRSDHITTAAPRKSSHIAASFHTGPQQPFHLMPQLGTSPLRAVSQLGCKA